MSKPASSNPGSLGGWRVGYLAAALLAFVLLACGGGNDGGSSAASTAGTCSGGRIASIPRDNVRTFSAPPERVIDPARGYSVTMATVRGNIGLQLDAANAPNTVNNFVFLACHGFYDNITWHRVEPNFVIQTGDPVGNPPGTGGPGYTFGLEISDLKHDTAGTLGMARANDPNSNGSQWYITTAVTASTRPPAVTKRPSAIRVPE